MRGGHRQALQRPTKKKDPGVQPGVRTAQARPFVLWCYQCSRAAARHSNTDIAKQPSPTIIVTPAPRRLPWAA